MKLFLLILVNLIFINKACSQHAFGKMTIEIEIDSDTVFTKAAVVGPVPRGDSTWKDSVLQKMNTSTFIKNGAPKGKYTVMVQYLIDNDGSIEDVKCLTDSGYGMCKEAMSAIRSGRGPRWKPAPQGGREVRPFRKSSNVPRQ